MGREIRGLSDSHLIKNLECHTELHFENYGETLKVYKGRDMLEIFFLKVLYRRDLSMLLFK